MRATLRSDANHLRLVLELVATPPQVSKHLAFSEPQQHQFDQHQRRKYQERTPDVKAVATHLKELQPSLPAHGVLLPRCVTAHMLRHSLSRMTQRKRSNAAAPAYAMNPRPMVSRLASSTVFRRIAPVTPGGVA